MRKYTCYSMLFIAALFVVFAAGCNRIPDTTPPQVSFLNPANRATDVPINRKIAVTFSEAMCPLSITKATFTLEQGTTPVKGRVAYADTTATFMPASELAPDTVYTATITTGAKDLAGNALENTCVWSFTTGTDTDTTAPTVTFVNPENLATDVPINRKIAVTFSEGMDPKTITKATFTIKQAKGDTPVTGTIETDVAETDVTETDVSALRLNGLNVWGKPACTGVTATFTPARDLDPNTLYTATITTKVKDLAGNALASDFVWSFTTGPDADTTAPTVTGTINANGATNVAINTKVGATFSEAMDPMTITTATFTLEQGTTPVTGKVAYTGVTATFIPDDDLALNTVYTVTIKGGGSGAKDLAGNALESDFVISWTTGAAADTTAPTVTGTINANGATNVAINTKAGATFSEAMDPLTITNLTFTLEAPVGTPVIGTVSYSGVNAVFIPLSNLAPSTLYTVTIKGGVSGAKDLAGNPLASDYVWSWTTGATLDTTAPTVTSTSPFDTETHVPINTKVGATFSEALDPMTITTATFTLEQGTTPVTGKVAYTGVTATFTPDVDLATNTVYTATITTGAKDLAIPGNALASAYVWTFTTAAKPADTSTTTSPNTSTTSPPTSTTTIPPTDTTHPTVTSTNPANLDVRVAINKKIVATFSEAMKDSTINTANYMVTGPGITPVIGTVAYDPATHVATFNPGPNVNLLPSTEYTATITTGATDLAGNPLEVNKEWKFTTGTTVAQTVPQASVPLGSSSNFAILASAAITNIPTSAITGDVGLTPDTGSNITGFSVPATCPEVTGTIYAVDVAGPACAVADPTLLTNAKTAALAAFDNARAAARGNPQAPQAISGDLNGLTLYPGLYESGTSLEISPGGHLYLDAQGDVNAVFVIRSATSITTEAASQVVLTKGAKATNVYWTAGSAVTLGTNSIMKGTIIAGTGISLLTGANLEGRALNQGPAAEAITLDANIITVPSP